jgi:23S rRNA (adenine-N6)-dimethyltransferase
VSGQPARPARSARRAPGRHLLVRRAVAELVDDACVRPGDRVLDLGAGTGHVTAALRRAGAHVEAVELDPRLADAVRRRFAADPAVRVVEGDAREVALPDVPYRVVANLPFAGSGAILDRLLDPRGALVRADVVLEWGAARKRCEVWPSTARSVVAGAFFRLVVERRLAPACFEPPPSVDAAVLVAERRERPRVEPADAQEFAQFVRAGFAAPRLAVGLGAYLAPRRLRRLADALAFGRDAVARDLDARAWSALYAAVRGEARAVRGILRDR